MVAWSALRVRFVGDTIVSHTVLPSPSAVPSIEISIEVLRPTTPPTRTQPTHVDRKLADRSNLGLEPATPTPIQSCRGTQQLTMAGLSASGGVSKRCRAAGGGLRWPPALRLPPPRFSRACQVDGIKISVRFSIVAHAVPRSAEGLRRPKAPVVVAASTNRRRLAPTARDRRRRSMRENTPAAEP